MRSSVGRALGPLLVSDLAWIRSVAFPLALAFVCLRSLRHDGYLLQVDAVFGPRPGPIDGGFGAPIALLQAGAVELFGGDVTGRLYAAATLFFAGFAPMVLLRGAPWYGQAAAGMLGALNPWVYDRLVEGQWGVVIAAAGLFLWVATWENLQSRPGVRSAVLLAACGALIVAFDPHAAGPLAVLTIVGILWQRLWRRSIVLRWTGVGLGLLALFLSYGVLSFFLDDSRGGYNTVRQFTRADFEFFRAVSSDDYGLLPNLAGLYGYWGERIGRFPLANEGAAWWPVATAVIVGAALVGAWLTRGRAWLLVCGVVGLGISASTALPGGVSAADWLASHVPAVGAYREPQKWSALWLLALVTLSVGAVDGLHRRSLRSSRAIDRWAAPALAYAIVLCALFPAGVAQIRSAPEIVTPVRYPDYWYRTSDYLVRALPRDEPVVVLPWHLYQPLAASEGRLAANPARQFFSGQLVVPQNLEIPGRFSEIESGYDRIGLVARRTGQGSCAVAREIRRQGIRWALVLDAQEGRETVLGLRRCGFTLVQGRPGQTAVLRADV